MSDSGRYSKVASGQNIRVSNAMRKSPSFSEQLQEKCRSLGSLLSPGKLAIFKHNDSKSQMGCSEGITRDSERGRRHSVWTGLSSCEEVNNGGKTAHQGANAEHASRPPAFNKSYSFSTPLEINTYSSSGRAAHRIKHRCGTLVGYGRDSSNSSQETLEMRSPHDTCGIDPLDSTKAINNDHINQAEPWEKLTFVTYPEGLLG